MKTNNKPQFIKQLGKVCAIGIPVVVFIIIATSIMMYSIDKENVRNRIFREFNSLDQTSRIYDGSDYTKRDLFYVRMKEAEKFNNIISDHPLWTELHIFFHWLPKNELIVDLESEYIEKMHILLGDAYYTFFFNGKGLGMA